MILRRRRAGAAATCRALAFLALLAAAFCLGRLSARGLLSADRAGNEWSAADGGGYGLKGSVEWNELGLHARENDDAKEEHGVSTDAFSSLMGQGAEELDQKVPHRNVENMHGDTAEISIDTGNLTAVVISVNPQRCNHALGVIRSVGIGKVKCVEPVDPQSEQISARIASVPPDTIGRRRILSNLLTFAREWDIFGGSAQGKPDDWRIFFEDDIILVEDVDRTKVLSAIWHGFELAREDGFLYLGLCPVEPLSTRVTWNGFVFNKGEGGRCAHAYALNRKRATTLWAYLDSPQAYPPASYKQFFRDEIMESWPLYMDVRLNSFALHHPVWVVSSGNTYYAPRGIFVQDRNLFPTAIDS